MTKQTTTEKLKREEEAFDRLYMEAKTDRDRKNVMFIYYGRYQKILEESDVL